VKKPVFNSKTEINLGLWVWVLLVLGLEKGEFLGLNI